MLLDPIQLLTRRVELVESLLDAGHSDHVVLVRRIVSDGRTGLHAQYKLALTQINRLPPPFREVRTER